MSIIKYNSILDIFLKKLIPETKKSVSKGNKIFGAFVISKLDYKLITLGTNNEIINPIYHGEIVTILNFFKLKNLQPKDYLFVSSHEPCSLCLSAITWGGFDNFYYFFPYEDTKKKFKISHDLNILKEVFNIEKGKYKIKNYYWESNSILDNLNYLNSIETSNLLSKIEIIRHHYNDLSTLYQNSKNLNNIPLK